MTKSSILKIEPLSSPWQVQDPFLLAGHPDNIYPKGNEKLGLNSDQMKGHNIGQDFIPLDGFRMYHGSMVPGFPHHPHSGFETISIVEKGVIDHSDSHGGAGRYEDGDVQWMTAGKGIQHSEMFPLVNADKENPLEMFQIWLNLPSKSKKVDAHYKMLWREDVPIVFEKDDNGKTTTISVVAGTLNGTKAAEPTPNSWASNPENEVTILTIKMEAGATFKLPTASEKVNRNLYFYKGKNFTIDGQSVNDLSHIALNPSIETTITNGSEYGCFLLLQGKPINEPVAQYGPFVANTEQEIRDIMAEYGKTQFGGWPWPMMEQVWERNKGRFAKYEDGTEENK